MGLFTTAMFLGSAKFLAKWIVRRYLPDEPWAEAIATELGGEAGKKSLAKIIAVLDTRLSVVARSSNPEFDRENIKYAAVDKEVELTLAAGLSNATLADQALNDNKVLAAVLAARAPIGLGEAETELYKQVVAESVRIACQAASSSPKFRTAADRLLLDRSKETTDGVKSLQTLLLAMGESANGTRSELAEIKESLSELSIDASFGEFEYRYCSAVIDELDEVRLFGIDERVRPEAKKQKLSTAYLSLNLTDEKGSSAPMSIDQLFRALKPTKRPYLLIRGDAGSGKSTLLKKLAIDRACLRVPSTQVHRAVAEFLAVRNEVMHEDLQRHTLFHLWPAAKRSPLNKAGSSEHALDAAWFAKSMISAGVQATGAIDILLETWSRAKQRIPFFIPLRRCRGRRLPSLHQITTLAGDGLPEASKAWAERVIDEGRAIFLVDGLDEVAPQHRKDIDAGLESWFKQFGPKGNLFIVTSRPLVKDPSWVADYKFIEARVAPMSRPAREQFIDAWHKAAAEALGSSEEVGAKNDAATFPQKASALKDKLAKRPGISRVASNPLMCAMICALSTDVNYDIDRSPREIIETLCRVLVHEREKSTPHLDSNAFPACYYTLTPDQRLEILGNLAFEMILSDMSVAGFEVLEKHAKATLAGLAGAKPGDAVELAAMLIERSGLLVKSRPVTGTKPSAAIKSSMRGLARPDVDWVHATFKEFLAAEHFTASHEEFLLKNWDRPDVRNVCVHLAAQRGTKATIDSLLTWILDHKGSKQAREVNAPSAPKARKQAKAEQDRQRQREYLALRIDEAAGGKILPEMRRRLDALRRQLLPPASFAAAEALAALGDEVLPYLRWSEKIKLKPRVQQACVRALRLIEHEDAKDALREYVTKATDMGVIGELAEAGINPLTIPLVLKLLSSETTSQAHLDRNERVPTRVRQLIKDVTKLAGLKHLRRLNLSGTGLTDIKPLSGLAQLRTLDLGGTQIESVAPLAGLVQLEELSLTGTGVTDLTPLAGLKRLRALNLDITGVTDLTPLAGLIQLQSLHLVGSRVTNLEPLAGLAGLTTLSLGGTSVTDVTPLAGLNRLEQLYLSDTLVTQLASLATLTELNTLYLDNTGVADLSPLAGMTKLQTLALDSTNVTDVTPLTGLIRLEVLNLALTKVSDTVPLSGLTRLRYLSLYKTGVVDVTPLGNLVQLNELDLEDTLVTDVTSLSGLTQLDSVLLPQGVHQSTLTGQRRGRG